VAGHIEEAKIIGCAPQLIQKYFSLGETLLQARKI